MSLPGGWKHPDRLDHLSIFGKWLQDWASPLQVGGGKVHM